MIQKRLNADGTTSYRARHSTGPLRTFQNIRDAREYVAEQARETARRRAGLETKAEAITFGQLYERWLTASDPSDWTLSMVAPALDAFEDKLVSEIRTDQIGRWLDRLRKPDGKEYAEKTRRHMLTAFRQVLNAGVDYGYLSRSPASPRFRTSLAVPSDTRAREIRPFNSWDEVVDVAGRFHQREKDCFVRFCCLTGVRVPSEAFGLRWDSVDKPRQIITVHGTKTEGSLRTIPLSDTALAILDEMPRQIGGYIFTFDYYAWRRYEWPGVLTAAGLEQRTPYEMRHTFATLALSNGASIADVASAMGHTDIQRCFSTYRAWTREMHDRLRNDLNQIGAIDDRHADHVLHRRR